jgi:2,4'-dihydroxyacetophenone dioxygenase
METTMLYEHIDTAVIDGESLPWVPLTPYSEDILLKYFKLDPIRGEWIVLMKAPPGVQLPKHHHTGTVMVYTIEGKWKYEEHDWVAGPGSIVYETAASTHTFEVVEAGKNGDVLTLVQVTGDLLFLDGNDNIVALENWKSGLQRYLAYCEQHGIKPKDLTAFN